MSKIEINKDNFAKYMKKGISLALIPFIMAFAGCSNDDENKEELTSSTSVAETSTENITSTTQIEEKTSEEITTAKEETQTTNTEEETKSNPYKKVSVVVDDKDFPIYSGTDENGFTYLITEDNQKISTAYDYHVVDPNSETIKIYHQTSENSDLKTWFDLYSYDGERLLNNLSYTTFEIIPGTDLAVYKFEETDDLGILRMREDYCERIIHSKFTNVATYKVGNSSADEEEKDIYIIGINENNNETIVYTTNLEVVAQGEYSVDEACQEAENYHTSQDKKQSTPTL